MNMGMNMGMGVMEFCHMMKVLMITTMELGRAIARGVEVRMGTETVYLLSSVAFLLLCCEGNGKSSQSLTSGCITRAVGPGLGLGLGLGLTLRVG